MEANQCIPYAVDTCFTIVTQATGTAGQERPGALAEDCIATGHLPYSRQVPIQPKHATLNLPRILLVAKVRGLAFGQLC